jgi:flagellar basal-body rod protein FlgG
MNGAFYIGSVGLSAQQRALDVVANNIANINTIGFKRSAVRFADLVAPVRNELGVAIAASNRSPLLAGVAVTSTPHVWTQGELRTTGRPLDLAIDGQGFIECVGPSGRSLLSRGGMLKVNEDGYLSAADGTPLRAMISVPLETTSLLIARDGVVAAQIAGEDGTREIGRIELVMVKDPNGLVDVGGGYYEAPDAASTFTVEPGMTGGPSLAQGALESANVRLTDEMTELLLIQRAFAANAQVVQAGDQLTSIVNELRR